MNRGAGVGIGANLELRSDERGAVADGRETHAARAFAVPMKAATVVGDDERQAGVGSNETNGNGAGSRMTHRITQGLLSDAKEMHGDMVVFDGSGAGGLEMDVRLAEAIGHADQSFQGRGEAVGDHLHRGKAPGEIAGLGDGFLDHFLNDDGGGDILGAVCLQGDLQAGEGAIDGGEILAEAIVEIAAEFHFFGFADLEDLLLEEAGALERGDLGALLLGLHAQGVSADRDEEKIGEAVERCPKEGVRRGVRLGEGIGGHPGCAAEQGKAHADDAPPAPRGQEDGNDVEEQDAELPVGDVIDITDGDDEDESDGQHDASGLLGDRWKLEHLERGGRLRRVHERRVRGRLRFFNHSSRMAGGWLW